MTNPENIENDTSQLVMNLNQKNEFDIILIRLKHSPEYCESFKNAEGRPELFQKAWG